MDRKLWTILVSECVSAPDDGEDNTETRWAIQDKGVKNALKFYVFWNFKKKNWYVVGSHVM